MAGRRILCVDDELDMRVYLRALLGSRGYEVEVAKNGREGIAAARRRPPELIVLDVMMPEAGGVQMYRELKADPQLAGIPVILVSGVGQKSFGHYLKMLAAAGGEKAPPPQAYLEKPLDQERLLDLVAELLG